jgi:hypothetical protein
MSEPLDKAYIEAMKIINGSTLMQPEPKHLIAIQAHYESRLAKLHDSNGAQQP